MPLHVYGSKFAVDALITSNVAGIARPKAILFKQGILSPGAYIDNRKLSSHPVQHDTILTDMAGVVRRLMKEKKCDILASVATGGIAHAAIVAWKMGLPHVVVRLEEKGYSMRGNIDGDTTTLRHAKVLLIEDTSSTFKSCLDAIELLKNAGARVEVTLLISTWNFPDFKKNIAGYIVHTLCTGEMILDRMVELGKVDQDHEEIVRNWLLHPEDESWADSSWQTPVRKKG